MKRFEVIAELVKEHRALRAEVDAARQLFRLMDDLRDRLDAEIAQCKKSLNGFINRHKRLEELIEELTEGEEWMAGPSEPDESETWWHEEAE